VSHTAICWIFVFGNNLSEYESMNLWIKQDGFRSSMYVITIWGQSHEPWGMPPVIQAQSERELPSWLSAAFHWETRLTIVLLFWNASRHFVQWSVAVSSVECLTVICKQCTQWLETLVVELHANFHRSLAIT